jgi:amino-acid N-acetyltransferase
MTTIQVEPAEPADTGEILALLDRTHLPKDGLLEHLASTFVARRDGRIVGSAALEVYPDGALLRSVAVDPEVQGAGLGHRLVDVAIAHARDLGVPTLFLLTLTAERFFPRFGFARIERAEVPPGVQTSIEFRSACPASAVVMRRPLD